MEAFFRLISIGMVASGLCCAQLIQIGSQKQLFVDDYLIESLTRAKRVMNPAQKVWHNPVIRADRPWEGNDVRVSHVIFDKKEGLFRMWYSGRTFRARPGSGAIVVEGEGQSIICLATSEDGIHWEKPFVGKVEFQGSKQNNILPPEQFMPYFFLDEHEKDPAKRYKGLIRTGSTDTTMQFDLYYSPDGFHWTPHENNPVIDTSPRIGRWGPATFLGWDPIRKTYAAHLENCLHKRCSLGKRLIGRAESPDMIRWTEPETILVPDERDYPDTEFYSMPALVYEGVYVGMLWNFRTTNTSILPHPVFSRDGIHYSREFREPFIAPGDGADFDSSVVYANAPLVHAEKILTYYTGANWRSPQDLLALGDKAMAAIGLAITPLDGFVSVDGAKGSMELNRTQTAVESPDSYSQMVTRAFTFAGKGLYLNLKCALKQWGAGPCDVRVEILGPDHQPVAGFRFDEADPVTETAAAHQVSWKAQPDLSALEGKSVKLRFYFKNAKLYSFQFR